MFSVSFSIFCTLYTHTFGGFTLTIHEFWNMLVYIGTVCVSKNVTFEDTSDLRVVLVVVEISTLIASYHMLLKSFVPRSTI